MATDRIPSFGELLRRHRLAAGLSQESLAEQAGLSRRGISDLERGVNRTPRKDTVALLARALALPAPHRAALEVAARRGGAAPAQSQAVQSGSGMPLLVGRGSELDRLERHLGGEGPPLLVLAGEPGIGKTRLLQEAALRAPSHGFRVLAGGCQRRGGQEPYAPLLQALEREVAAQPPATRRTALRGCAWLVRLLPELAGSMPDALPAWILPPEQERRLMFGAVARLLQNVAGPAGILLVLDDLQWASADALELLASLLRSHPECPLRVVGAYRDTEVQAQDPLAVLLADLAQADLAGQLPIGPLAVEEARQLVEALRGEQSAATGGLTDQALQRLGGVPFFVVNWARSLHAAQAVGQSALPWAVGQSIRQRATALPVAAQEVLAAGAVLGRVASRSLLGAVCGLEHHDLLAGLDAACRARLLEQDGQTTYRFVHDVIREALEGDLGPARRAALHQRAGEAMERLSGPAAIEALAYHFARGEAPERALPYLEQAGDRARAQYAHSAAAGYYRELIVLLNGMDAPAALASACEKLGGVLSTLTQYDPALEVLERAASIHAMAGALDHLGRVTAQIGLVLGQKGATEEGLARLAPLLDLLEARAPSPALAELYTTQSQLYLNLFQEELTPATRAVALARALRDDPLLAKALARLGYALISAGRVAESLQTLSEAHRLAESIGDLVSLCRVHVHASVGHYALGELAASVRSADMALEVARCLGDPMAIVSALANRGRSTFLMGDWSRARSDLESAVALAGQSRATLTFLSTSAYLGECLLAAGEWDEAARRLQEIVTVTKAHGMPAHGRFRHAQGLLAELDLYCGRPESARDRLLPLAADENTFATWIRTQLAWAYLELGELDRAAELVARALAQARAEQHRVRLVDALRVQALVLAELGQAEQAASALDEGLGLTPALPFPYGEARLLHVYGKLHLQRGEPAAARERLEAALAIFGRLGARKDSEQVEGLLARLR